MHEDVRRRVRRVRERKGRVFTKIWKYSLLYWTSPSHSNTRNKLLPTRHCPCPFFYPCSGLQKSRDLHQKQLALLSALNFILLNSSYTVWHCNSFLNNHNLCTRCSSIICKKSDVSCLYYSVSVWICVIFLETAAKVQSKNKIKDEDVEGPTRAFPPFSFYDRGTVINV